MFHVPARFAKLGGQPIEQLGMGWHFSLTAEVVEHAGKSAPEELLPEAVCELPRRQRVFRGHQPVGEIEPGEALAIGRGLACEELGKRGLHDFARVHPVAARQEADGGDFVRR